ncbi:TRAP transporter, DctM subunit [Hoeflea phototrophica DFL-43]|uniref:TRAP transporter large permease protein n=1 Tax=Hoeflea phototrophica (strain DSM 17068 / NCIMB 14078 / DFL-43) TaxID=411684 RepID=A9D832_HOEPD|nr:TRAP transporter large permease [Hoeflea phototrophica]EDQ33210.1 TRAP transporter, DctM subunit [Hoeflea phototrophica DFL-43]
MSNIDIALLSFPVLLALIFLRIPIGLAMLITGIGGSYFINGSFLMIFAQLKNLTWGTFSSYSLSIIPLFLLMGQFATLGGMSQALFRAAETWIGHKKGGVAMAAVGACAGFGAICGSSLATAATMGQVALPELKRYGYSGELSTGALAAGGTLGILIPPSVILVIYAILTEQNIAKLFVAAFIPGILAALGYMMAIAIYVRLKPGSAGSRERAPYSERFRSLLAVWPVLIVFITVVGGIYGGIFTPTEAAAIGAFGTGVIALFNGGLNRSTLISSILTTASATGMIFLIVFGAGVYNSFLALSQLPQTAAAFVGSQDFNPWLVMIAVLILYLVFGCVMDSLSMVLLTVPIFFPIMSALDFGLSPEEFALWFGIIVLIVVEVGLITPPVGMNLFVINSMAKDTPLAATYRGVLPFVLTDIVRVAILTMFPAITLVAVRLLY